METVEKWKKYLDDADEAETLALEIGNLPVFNFLLQEVCVTAALYDLVKEVWDIAYSYGKHDAMADEGLTLQEIIESGE